MDSEGNIVGTAGYPLAVSRPHRAWSEQSPEDWWQGTLRAIDQLRERLAMPGFTAPKILWVAEQSPIISNALPPSCCLRTIYVSD
jgi:xylulokinase